ncbi:cell wall-binding repeat-containing protein [Candidatus Poriferisodalis sp.]|uniref:cell wall-binding repeat-containing protein n=1 Tax=Candidatus Poriferisodalis sp. TaxID=3101277 RepID=UPI003B019A79
MGVGTSLVAGGGADVLLLAAGYSTLGIETAEVLAEVSPSRVVLVGGNAILGGEIESDIERLIGGITIERLAGADRIETAADGARALPGFGAGGSVIVANGWSLADVGIAAGGVASGLGDAVLYSARTGLGAATVDLLAQRQPSRVLIVGGTKALDAAIEAELGAVVPSAAVDRLGGSTRIETAALVAESTGTANSTDVVVVNGWRSTEVGIAASLAAAAPSTIVLYSDAQRLSAAAARVISRHGVEVAALVGNDEALSARVGSDVAAMVSSGRIERLVGRTDSGTAAQAARRALHGPRAEGSQAHGVFRALSSGGGHACGVSATSDVYCWGNNEFGQLEAPRIPFDHVDAGWGHTCAASPDDTARCWGNDEHGQIVAPEGELRSISSGVAHSCALDRDGRARCWGLEIADASEVPRSRLEMVASGAFHSCGIEAGGVLHCWGNNKFGQLDTPAGEFQSVTSGGAHSCALETGGEAVCWGNNDVAQAEFPAGVFTAISAGWASTCGLRPDGAVECWGHSDVAEDAPTARFSSISVGWSFACGIRLDGPVECWGDMSILGYEAV